MRRLPARILLTELHRSLRASCASRSANLRNVFRTDEHATL